ncbi:MAG: uroporphyrinogen-III C-methyltransferase [Proteobacteria bacterium]|nr:uroporphyrinogen-III C-methyltransferase [Pseudomonadota bacterium]
MSKPSMTQSKSIAKKSEATTDESSQEQSQPGQRRVFWTITVLVALVASGVGGSYYLYRLLDVTKSHAEQSGAAITTTRSEVGNLEKSLGDVRQILPDIVNEQQAADKELQKQLDLLTDGMRQMNTLLLAQQKRLAAMGSSELSAQRAWVQAEVIFLLRAANQRLDLAADRDGAIKALQIADRRLADLGTPAFTPVRAEIADEIRLLEAVPVTDIEGMVYRLAGFADSVQSLPLVDSVRMQSAGVEEADASDGWSIDRAFNKMKKAFGSMIRVSRSEEEIMPVLAPKERFFLRRNLELQFEMARLSAIQRDQENFDQSLDKADSWLRRYFDADNSEVGAILAAIESMKVTDISPPLPGISGSLILMLSASDEPGETL